MIFNVHAGHNPDGKTGCGAIGLIKESTEARWIKEEVICQLRLLGHIVYDCTVEDGYNASDVLKKIVAKCNSNHVDLDVSIHLNAGRNDYAGDGKLGGTEVFIYSASSNAVDYAQKTADAISGLGYPRRSDGTFSAGVKVNPSLYVLKNTKAPAMLIECLFVDDKDDVELYDYQSIASAIVYGMTGQQILPETEVPDEDLTPEEGASAGETDRRYRVQVGAYAIKDNASRMAMKLKDAGFDALIISS